MGRARRGRKREQATTSRTRPALLLIAGALALATFWAFAGALDNAFVFLDDDQYVTANPALRDGLTLASARWAFTSGYAANWHPLTWLSHALDVELFGLDPRGHHLVNLLFHVASTVTLLLLLRRLTGALWPSAAVAALFGLHPAHVESVAWVAERKDVLSMLLALATIAAWAVWSRRPAARRYALVMAVYALGLLAKPMLVTLPFVLMLLDVWPLGRLRLDQGGRALAGALTRRLVEKIPLLVLAAVSSVVTFLVQRAGGAVGSVADYPLDVRVKNAIVAYIDYLRDLAWPTELAIFYPHPGHAVGTASVIGAAVLLGILTALAWVARRRLPALLVGWLWFLGTLAPVIGLVQVGWQARADRYTYLPSVGLFVAVAWAIAWLATTRWRRAAVGCVACAAILACAALTRRQVTRWKNSETLFRHALAVTKNNFLAHNNLGHFYNEVDRPAEAMPHLEEAMRIRPEYTEACTNLGRSLFLMGRLDEAYARFEQAYRQRPDDPVVLNNLGFIRQKQGELDDAERWYRMALDVAQEWAEVHHKLAIVLLMTGRPAEAHAHLARAAELEPHNTLFREHLSDLERGSGQALSRHLASAHRELGLVLYQKGRPAEAEIHFARTVALDPSDAEARNNWGFMLFLQGRIDEAIRHYEEALRLRPDLVLARNNLAEARAQREK